MADIDLSQFSLDELKELSQQIEKERAKREVEEKKKVSSQIKELASSIGMTVEEILGLDMARKTKTPMPAKYYNPDNPRQTWSGRGKRPGWLNEALAHGRGLEDLQIKK
ncbi:MAG: H-NS histone family protein [Pseudomonadota bacterium]|nr:H-NS histone family protein [Pseudomonadota bacterium]